MPKIKSADLFNDIITKSTTDRYVAVTMPDYSNHLSLVESVIHKLLAPYEYKYNKAYRRFEVYYEGRRIVILLIPETAPNRYRGMTINDLIMTCTPWASTVNAIEIIVARRSGNIYFFKIDEDEVSDVTEAARYYFKKRNNE